MSNYVRVKWAMYIRACMSPAALMLTFIVSLSLPVRNVRNTVVTGVGYKRCCASILADDAIKQGVRFSWDI